MDILNFSITVLKEEKLVSVKLVATRCIIKYSRKVKNEVLAEHTEGFE